MKRVFISYAHEDREVAIRIYKDLNSYQDLQPWLDIECLLPGQDWRAEIANAMKRSDYFLALLSPRSVTKRGFVQKELREALDLLQEFPEGQIFVIPIRLNDCVVPSEQLQRLHYVDLFPSWDKGWKQVLRSLGLRESLREDFLGNTNRYEELIEFVLKINDNSVTSKKHYKKGITFKLLIDEGIGDLCIFGDSDSGDSWDDSYTHYYFSLEDAVQILKSLKNNNKANFQGECVQSKQTSQHDQYYPEEDYRKESVEKGSLILDLIIKDKKLSLEREIFESFHFSSQSNVQKIKDDKEIVNFAKDVLKNERNRKIGR